MSWDEPQETLEDGCPCPMNLSPAGAADLLARRRSSTGSRRTSPLNTGRSESQIVSAVLRACNLLPGVRLFRLNSRVVRMPGKGGRTRLVRFGWTGAPDIIGYVVKRSSDIQGYETCGPQPVAVIAAVEVKRPGGKATPEQQSFLDLVKRDGGIAGIVTSVEDAVRLLQ